jgi:DNA-binding NarL/FixJ family response regulator
MSFGGTLATERKPRRKRCFASHRAQLAHEAVTHPRPVLTPQQWRIAELVEQGLTNRQLASCVGTTAQTIKCYLHHVFRRIGVSSRLELAVWYRRQKGIEPTVSPLVLTGRMLQLSELVAKGCGAKDIATALGITEGTAKVYVSRLLAATDCKSSVELSRLRFIPGGTPDKGGRPHHALPLQYLKALVESAAVIR